MKRLIRWFSLFSLIVISFLGLLGWMQPLATVEVGYQPVTLLVAKPELPTASDAAICPEFAQKVDLNNANIVAFKQCQGFYPSLARLIVQHGPYQKVEDVLAIPGLSDRQIALLNAQLKNFIVTEPIVPLEMRMPPRPTMR